MYVPSKVLKALADHFNVFPPWPYEAYLQVNSGVNANPITTAVDQYMEQIMKKHEVDAY